MKALNTYVLGGLSIRLYAFFVVVTKNKTPKVYPHFGNLEIVWQPLDEFQSLLLQLQVLSLYLRAFIPVLSKNADLKVAALIIKLA